MNPGSPPARAYKAFISYSHAADGKLAPALQNALCRFAKPWYRRRAMRVFRDTSNLAVSPYLWSSIESALKESEYLLLLASPEAAHSEWVPKELDSFLQQSTPDRILLILTDGNLAWDSLSGDFDWSRTTAFPQLPRKIFSEEPLWADLRWAHLEDQLDARNPTFRQTIASVCSTLRGVPLDELIGQDVREHKRTIRLAWSAVGLISTLLVVALALLGLALTETKAAKASLARAQTNQSRFLASLSREQTDAGNGTNGILISLGALPRSIMRPDRPYVDEAETALFAAVQQNREQRDLIGHTGRVTRATFSLDGSRIVTASDDGTARVWDAATGAPCWHFAAIPVRSSRWFSAPTAHGSLRLPLMVRRGSGMRVQGGASYRCAAMPRRSVRQNSVQRASTSSRPRMTAPRGSGMRLRDRPCSCCKVTLGESLTQRSVRMANPLSPR